MGGRPWVEVEGLRHTSFRSSPWRELLPIFSWCQHLLLGYHKKTSFWGDNKTVHLIITRKHIFLPKCFYDPQQTKAVCQRKCQTTQELMIDYLSRGLTQATIVVWGGVWLGCTCGGGLVILQLLSISPVTRWEIRSSPWLQNDAWEGQAERTVDLVCNQEKKNVFSCQSRCCYNVKKGNKKIK